jgi:hypothetical protein
MLNIKTAADHYIYLFVREDLSKSQQIIQTAHAVDKLKHGYEEEDQVSNMVLIGAKNEQELIGIARYLDTHEIDFEFFNEPDMADQYTSIATIPLAGKNRKPLSKFQLMS